MKTIIPIVLVLLGAILAGCVGLEEDGEPGEGTGQSRPPPTADPEAEQGAIAGRVLTEGLETIDNARVVLAISGDELIGEDRTDAQGRFAFENLEPGEYRLQITAVCCREQIQRVEVKAGEVATADVLLSRLSDTDLKKPYVEEQEWEGYLGCYLLVSGVSVGNCGDPNNDRSRVFEVQEGLKTLVVTMEWDQTVGYGDELELTISRRGYVTYDRVTGTSPLEWRLDAGALDGDHDFENIVGVWELQFLVRPGDPGFVYQQPFTVHYDRYYWEPAADNARAAPDG